MISIVFTTYRPGGIDVLADSLRNQTFRDYELIIVDDFSIDRSQKIKDYLEKRYIPVRYIGSSKPKCFPELPFNVMNATNTGFILSTREVVLILQDFIWLPPDFLKNLVRHRDRFRRGYCIVHPGHTWGKDTPRINNGLISLWHRQWKGKPERNDCYYMEDWVPESWEFACTAIPWKVVREMNGYPECLDAFAGHPLKLLVDQYEAGGGKPFVDTDNFMHMLDHRVWKPRELWHQGSKKGENLQLYVPRENCFDLKTMTRGRAYWLATELKQTAVEADIFEKPEYWCGDIGYRPGPEGKGYEDFPINKFKADYIMMKQPAGQVLDAGCAMGHLVRRLRDRKIDAYGIDISEYAISQAPEEVKPYLKVAAIEDIPAADKEFDIVCSFATLEHLTPENVAKAINEIVRVGKRGVVSIDPAEDPSFDNDATHRTKQPLSWWKEQFPEDFEVLDDRQEVWLDAWKKEMGSVRVVAENVPRNVWVHQHLDKEATILDVGCADCRMWQDTDYKVTTLDKQVTENIKPEVVGEAENLPFEDKLFDIVCINELLEHVIEPKRVIEEATRVARQRVIITVPLEYMWNDELKPFWNPDHIRYYTPKLLKEELSPFGLPYTMEMVTRTEPELNHHWAWLGAVIDLAPRPEMVKLNLGSFVDVIPGWENIDILDLRQHIPRNIKFRQWDLRKGIPHPDNSVDVIRASHIIEHLTLGEAQNLCREMHRVLKPNGVVRISTPDVKIIINKYMTDDMRYFNIIQPVEFILAPTRGEKLSRILFSDPPEHKAIYDYEMLKDFLEKAGFHEIQRVSAGYSYSDVILNETQDQHQIVSLIVEAIK